MTNGWARRRWSLLGAAALTLAAVGTLATPAAQASPANAQAGRTNAQAGPANAQAAPANAQAGPANAGRPAAGSGLWRPAIPGFGKRAGGALGPAPAVSPAEAPWQPEYTPDPGGVVNGNLAAVSCSSASACTAVGSYFNYVATTVTLAERWNGTNWAVEYTPYLPGIGSAQLSGVSCPGPNHCVAAGYETGASGTIKPLVEVWNGIRWTVQYPVVPSGAKASGFLAISCTSADACTATGDNTNAAGMSLPLAERWNGTTWAIQATPHPSGAADSGLFAVSCAAATACTATGATTSSSGATKTLAETWNGTTWTLTATPSPSATEDQLEGVSCTAANACTAAGFYASASSGEAMTLAERWNGSTWTVQTTANPSAAAGAELGAVSCRSASACTAAGAYADSSTKTTVTLAETWNGSTWKVQATPNPSHNRVSGFNAVSCPAGACVAAGSSEGPRGTSLPLSERSNGTGWKIAATPQRKGAKDGELLGVSCPTPSACTAVGDYNATVQKNATLAERWNGMRWNLQTTPNPAGSSGGFLQAVSCSAATTCTAVGDANVAGGRADTLAETWHKSKWSIQATPNPAGARRATLSGVSCPAADACTAVGTYYTKAGAQQGFAEQWDGTSWRLTALAAPAGATTTSLAGVSCGSTQYCVAVGYSNTSTGDAQPLAEAWNGTTWRVQKLTLPGKAQGGTLSGVSCTAADACTAGGSVFAAPGGPFTENWNGHTWSYLAAPLPPGSSSSTSEIGFDSVACVAAQACVAVGFYTPSGAAPASFAEDWTGQAWQVQGIALPPGALGSLVFGVSCGGRGCNTVGSFIASSQQSVTLALRARRP